MVSVLPFASARLTTSGRGVAAPRDIGRFAAGAGR